MIAFLLVKQLAEKSSLDVGHVDWRLGGESPNWLNKDNAGGEVVWISRRFECVGAIVVVLLHEFLLGCYALWLNVAFLLNNRSAA